MKNFHVAPFGPKIFSNKPSMALHGFFLAAQEACLIQQFRGYFPFYLSCGKQCQKVPLVNRPASLALLETGLTLLIISPVLPAAYRPPFHSGDHTPAGFDPLRRKRDPRDRFSIGAGFIVPGSGGSGNAP